MPDAAVPPEAVKAAALVLADIEGDDQMRVWLALAAACCESAAQIITGSVMALAVVPSWRWTDEERAGLIGDPGA